MRGKQLRVVLVAMLCVAMLALPGCGKSTSVEGQFIVGFDASFPPYGYKDEQGEYVGFDLDLAQEVCNRMGWSLVKQPIDWDSKDIEIDTGTIDCIWNGFTINGKENDYTWSKAYVDNSQVVVVKSNSSINSLADLEGKTVIVQTASSALASFTGEDATEENKELCDKFKELQQVNDYNNAFMNLEAGSADAICLDIGVANYQIKQRGSAYRILDERVASELYGVGFKLGNTELRDQVVECLDEMQADGTLDSIAAKWELSDYICYNKPGTDAAYKKEAGNSGSSNTDKMQVIFSELSKGMLASLAIFSLTLLFSMPLGLLLTFIRMSRFKLVQLIAKFYISIVRGTPLMLQLIVVFFGPYYLFGVNISADYRFIAVIIGFSLNYAAYFAEIFRSGIQTISKGQREAACVLGYTKAQTFRKIIFPQMAKRVIPPVTNEVITLVKDTSLAFALAYTEMFTLAKQVAAAQASITPLLVAGLFYYIFNFVVAIVMNVIEKKMSYYR